jgi:hypothetical protein
VVTLLHEESNARTQFVTAVDGSYTFPFPDPGEYTLSVSHPGFKSHVRRGIIIRVATDQRVDIQLEVGQVAENVEVTAQAPLLESVSATLGQVVDNKKIVDLPLNGRNVLSLPDIIPGSSGGGATGSFASATNPSINGTRVTGNNFTVDGVSVNQEFTDGNAGSGSVYTPQVDSVAEFRVVTSNYSAEYGRAMGGVVAMILKSGTNQYHGTACEFLRNDKLNARNYFASPTAAKPALELYRRVQPREQPGAGRELRREQGHAYVGESRYQHAAPGSARARRCFSRRNRTAAAAVPQCRARHLHRERSEH